MDEKQSPTDRWFIEPCELELTGGQLPEVTEEKNTQGGWLVITTLRRCLGKWKPVVCTHVREHQPSSRLHNPPLH